MKKVIALTAAACVVLGQEAAAAVWYDVEASQIRFIRADGRAGYEGYFIQYTQVFPGDTGCNARDFAYIRKNDPLAKDMYSTALSALVAGKPITVATTGCDGVGNVVQAVAIKSE